MKGSHSFLKQHPTIFTSQYLVFHSTVFHENPSKHFRIGLILCGYWYNFQWIAYLITSLLKSTTYIVLCYVNNIVRLPSRKPVTGLLLAVLEGSFSPYPSTNVYY